MVQQLGFSAFTVVAWVQSLVRELRSHEPFCAARVRQKQTTQETEKNVKLGKFY